MVKVATCMRCGNAVSAQWGSVVECPTCGSVVREIDVDLGGRERIPRYLNWVGVALLIVVTLLFITTMTGLTEITMEVLLVLVGICIILLFGSIVYQQSLVKESIQKAPHQTGRSGPQRRVRQNEPPEREHNGRLPVKRPIGKKNEPAEPRKRAMKIVVGRR